MQNTKATSFKVSREPKKAFQNCSRAWRRHPKSPVIESVMNVRRNYLSGSTGMQRERTELEVITNNGGRDSGSGIFNFPTSLHDYWKASAGWTERSLAVSLSLEHGRVYFGNLAASRDPLQEELLAYPAARVRRVGDGGTACPLKGKLRSSHATPMIAVSDPHGYLVISTQFHGTNNMMGVIKTRAHSRPEGMGYPEEIPLAEDNQGLSLANSSNSAANNV
ncbi:hypothetical protein TESG_07250 [Trichophyton tonsurans CBS 112818]|uniref:Uncharacterized protein n=1 Tax=Trichophyton tonsurans (strain CBS 112818) TaxID=647933 RepID=F2S8M1_TRIT1|nr:hypothetical protein TESG_07250 [Trichophyton tonsurans CBS 112818]